MKIGASLIPLVGWGLDVDDVEGARESHLSAIRRLVEGLGVQAVELNGDFSTLYPGVFEMTYYERVANLQQKLGFACTLHLPFLWLDGLSLAEPVRRASTECVAGILQRARPLAVESYVLHLWGIWSSMLVSVQQMPRQERQQLLEAMLGQAGTTLAEVGNLVAKHKLCVENLEHFPFEAVASLIERHKMRVCLDVGHLTLSGGNALDFVDRYGDMIGEVHLHDALPDGVGGPGVRDHLALGRGSVEYARLLDQLKERGFDGVVILEVNTMDDLVESLERVKPWL